MNATGALLLTLIICLVIGTGLNHVKLPGGLLVGGIIGAAMLNIGFEISYMPMQAKLLAQIIAGAYIGITVKRSDLHRLKHVIKPFGLLMGNYLLVTLCLGYVIHRVSILDLSTALFSTVPGGISDIPLIAADMGANVSQVAVLQFVRLLVGLVFFPFMIGKVTKPEASSEQSEDTQHSATKESLKPELLHIVATLGAAMLCGSLGVWMGIPAGGLLFSMLGIILLNILWKKASFPLWLKRMAQVLSGAYIGSSISYSDFMQLRRLILPATLLVLGYSFNCFFTSSLLVRFYKMSKRESMLASIPAGASDMALISTDMDVHSPNLILLQVLRLIVTTSIFPQIIHLFLNYS